MGESYSVRAILSAVDSSFSSTLARAGQATQNFGSVVGQKMQGVGKAMTVAGAATTAMGAKALKGFGDFQSSLNQAAVIAGGTSKNIGELADVANRMGAELPISARDAAAAMVEMARNGASIGEIKKQFPAIAQAATAAGSDLQATAGVVQQAMNIWGDSLKSPQQAAAILVQTANASNASIEDMQQALATIGSTAKMAGMDMGTTAEAIGLLTNRGFSAAQASDDLNHAITQMLAPSSIAKKTMDELGLSFVDSAGKMKPFPTILQEIADKTNGMGDAQKTAALKAMFGASGMKAIAPLLDAVNNKTGDAKNSWSAYAAEQDKAASSTANATAFLKQQASDMQQNIGSKIEQVGGNWDDLTNKAMAAKGGVNGAMLDMTSDTLKWAATSDNAIARFTRGFIGLSPVIGPAITAVGGFVTNVSKITGVVGGAIGGLGNLGRTVMIVGSALKGGGGIKGAVDALKAISKESAIAKVAMFGLKACGAVFSGLTTVVSVLASGLQALWGVMLANPITAVIAIVAALVAGLALFFTKTQTGRQIWSDFCSGLQSAWQGLASTAQTVWNTIAQAVQGPVEGIKAAWSGISSFFSTLWQGIVTTAQGIWNSFTQGMAPIIDSIKNLWNALGEFFSTLWQGIVSTAQGIWGGLVAIFTPIVEEIKVVWQGLAAFFAPLWQGIVDTAQTIWQGLVNVVQTVWNTIQGVVQSAVQVLGTVIQTGMQVVQTVWSTTWDVVKTVVQTVWENISTIVSTAINAVAGIIRAITAAIKGDWSGAWNDIKGVAETVWNGITTVVSTNINATKSIVTSVMGGIKSVMGSIWNGIKSVTATVWGGIKSTVSSGMSGVRSTVSGMMSSVQSAFSSGWARARSVTSSGIQGAVSAVRGAVGGMVSAGRNFVMGFVNGISGAIGAAASAAAHMAHAAMSAAKSALGIHSPSRVMRDEVGYYVAAGMAVGMSENADLVQKAANRLAQYATPTTDLGTSINGVLSQGNLGDTVTGTINHELNVNQQPAFINVSLGGSDYATFVDDISREQGNQAMLKRNYRF
ncbi:phage tail tape measure protein [Limosilactobacillus fermentum]|uniref:phage tail tape measure protein n=1 Tax=Limosilactobacillus fermentum TaxID=1613 RepID=UPI0031DC43C3